MGPDVPVARGLDPRETSLLIALLRLVLVQRSCFLRIMFLYAYCIRRHQEC